LEKFNAPGGSKQTQPARSQERADFFLQRLCISELRGARASLFPSLEKRMRRKRLFDEAEAKRVAIVFAAVLIVFNERSTERPVKAIITSAK